MFFSRQLNKVIGEVDLMQTLFDRAGGAKHAGEGASSSGLAKKRRSSPDVNLFLMINIISLSYQFPHEYIHVWLINRILMSWYNN